MMISKTIKQTRARIDAIMSEVLVFLLLLIPYFYVSLSPLYGQETDVIETGELIVQGVRLEINPARQTVPINTETIVNTVFIVDKPELVEGMIVKGILRGPGIKDSITLTTLPNHPFAIPGFTSKGTYTLENIHLEKDGKVLVPAQPDQAVIEAMDIIITRVESRPLTLEEIREKGIVLSEENFSVYNFSVGFLVNSQEVRYEFPIVYSGNNEVFIPTSNGATGVGGSGGRGGNGPVPVSFDIPDLPVPVDDIGRKDTNRPISGVVIFNNDIAFLNQFFSVMFIVTNQAPDGSPLALKDITAKIELPTELREAKTNPPHLMGAPIPVRCPGPDGKIGTADDLDIILATFSGMAEFLAEGLKEGTHIVKIDFKGTLSGLPSGDAPFTGTASGAVIVRNPAFGITFTHPAVIRKGEEYDVYVNMTNTSPVTANLVSLTMPASRLIGTSLLSDETVSWETIEPGESVTAKFHMLSNETGKIGASAFEAEGNVSGRFVLSVGVGEKGIPLSPDTLVLPDWTYSLPNDLINATLILLGEAYCIATTPPGGLPEGLPYIKAALVKERALEFADAGQRYTFGDTLINTVEVLTLDWLGNQVPDLQFDILRRLTSKGLKFAQQQAIIFNDSLNSQGAIQFQRSFAETCSYKPPFISALLSSGTSSRDAHLRITDFYKNRLSNEQGTLNLIRNIPYGELYLMENPGQTPIDFALIGRPDKNGYTLEVLGTAEGTFDLSLIVPDTAGGFRQVIFTGISSQPGSIARITFTSANTDFILSIDNNGDGLEDSQATGNVTPVQEPPLRLIGAVQECSADSAGHATALFFNRTLDPETAKNKTNYFIPDKTIYASFLQPSGRVVLIGTNNPISPFVETKVRVENLKDTSGGLLTPSPTEMTIIPTIQTPGGIVSGKILSALGEPIANAKIQMVEKDGFKYTLSYDISDSTGCYQFDFVRIFDDPFTIEVLDVKTNKIERVSSRLMSHGQRLQIDIIMQGRGSVQGRVLNTSGILQADAIVMARVEGTDLEENFTTYTDENGEYIVNNIPIGVVNLCAGKSSQFGSANTAITAPDQIRVVDITVVAAKTANVSGRVFYNDGITPAAKAYVNFYGEGQYTTGTQTDGQGYFQFHSVPIGTFSLSAFNPLTGSQGGYVTGQLVENQDYNATIIFRGTGRIYGKVMSYDNVPQPGVLVYLSGTSFHMDTDSSGNFDFPEVPVGNYWVNAAHRTINLNASSMVKLIAEGQEAYVSLVFPSTLKGSITGKVYDVDGTTILPNIRVFLCNENYTPMAFETAKANGTFFFGDLSPGFYSLLINRTDSNGNSHTTIQYPGHQAVCDLKFIGKGKVNIDVFAADGQSPITADVNFYHLIFEMNVGHFIGFRGVEEQYTTDENGHLEIDEVYMGAISVTAQNPFYPRGASYYGKISSPGQEVDVNLVMKPTGKVKVHVLSHDNQTVAGAALEFQAGSLPWQKGIFTDVNGTYEFTLVPPGGFRVNAESVDPTHPSYGLKGICYGTMGENGDLVEVTLKLLGKGQVNGVVKTQSGALIQGAKVTIKNIGYPHETFNTTTDENGCFSQSSVWQGKFTVSAYNPLTLTGGRAEGEIPAHNTQANVELVLDAIGTVKGRVMNPDGVSEMTDAQVVLYHSKFEYEAIGYFYVSQEGGYTFENIPKGQFYLEALHPASGRKGKKSGTLTTEGQVVESDVYLEGRGTVTGTFYDGSRVNPVPYAGIEIKSQGTYPFTLQSTTDADGHFTFPQVACGEFDLDATDPSNNLRGAASGQVEYDGETVYIDVFAQGWGIVKGIVYDAQGTGKINGAAVKLTQGSKVWTVSSGPDLNNPNDPKQNGEYEFTLVPVGSFNLVAYDPVTSGRDYGTASGKIEFHGQVVTLDITFKGLGSVTGRVLDVVNGEEYPQSDVPVTLTSGNEKFPSASNSEGIYSFTNVRMGPFSLEAKQGSTNLSASGSGELTTDGQTVTIDLILEPAGSVTGRVLKPDGSTPAKNAYLKLKGTNITKYYYTGEDGVFEFKGVRIGAFTLEVQGYNLGGKARVSGQVSSDGEIIEIGDLVLDNELPQVTAIKFPDNSDVNGSTGIPLNTALTVHFSEPMAASSITNSNIYLNSSLGKVNITPQPQPGKTAVVLGPLSLSSFILYTLHVNTSVEDTAGNTPAAAASASFTTSDILPPVVSAINPANNAQGVPVNAVITVFFNEPIDPGNFSGQNLQITKNNAPVTGTVKVNTGNTGASFTPSTLETDSKYTITVLGARDFSGNTQTTAFTSNFYTTDTLSPTFKSISPAGGTTVTEGGPVTVTVTFNETDIAVVHFSVNGETKYSDTGSPYQYQFTTPLISQAGSSLMVEILAVDKAGNQSTKANLTINLKQDVPPLITLTGPAVPTVFPGGTINCKVTASDDLGLSRVVLTALGGNLNYSNTQNISNSTGFTKNYTIAVPADIQPGTDIILHAQAVDVRTNVTNAKDIILKVPQDDQAPQITISTPNAGDTFVFGSKITINAKATDDVAIKVIRIYFNDTLLGTFTQSPCTAEYITDIKIDASDSVIKVEAEDLLGPSVGHISTASINIKLTEPSDPTAPKVKILSPSEGALVYAGEDIKIKIEAVANPETSIDTVEVFANEQVLQTLTQSPYEVTYPIPTDAAAGSTITFKAVANDHVGKTGTAQSIVEVVSGTVIPAGTVIEANNTTYDNQTIIINDGTVTINGAHTFVNVLVKESGTLTHSAATITKTSGMQLTVTGKLVIGPEAKINAVGRGYQGAYSGDNTGTNYGRTLGNTISGGSYKYSGGSYGGYGGQYTDPSQNLYESNKIYGSIENPSDPGSGGGAASSGSPATCGGGVIIINSASVINDGTITSNANNTTSAGAGSGGSINIHTGILNGSGTITANGGSNTSTSSTFGAGSGGRIAVYYENASGFNLANITAYGGKFSGSSYALNASAGTVYLEQTYQEPQLILNNNAIASKYREIFPVIGPGVITNLSAAVLTDATASYMTDSLIGMELIPDINNKEQTFTIIDNDKNTITIDSVDGDLTQVTKVDNTYGGLAVFDGHLKIINTPAAINGEARLGNLSVLEGSRLGQTVTTATNEYYLSLHVPGKIIIDETSTISVNSSGYMGSTSSTSLAYTLGNTTTGGSAVYSGGSHGGLGAQYLTNAVNNVYGSIYDPRNPGSGGGGTSNNASNIGGSGGGVIILEAGEILLAGTITANGGEASAAGGGSGGSIQLHVTTLKGIGTITANGGNSSQYAAGGGGRIAVYYEDASNFDLSKITTYGGIWTGGSSESRNGGAGTIYLEKKGEVGEIIIDNNSSDSSNGTPLPGTLDTTGNIILDSCQAKLEGNLKVEEMTLIDATLSINGLLEADRLNMQNGSLVTHSYATSSTTYSLEIKANEITIDESSSIDVTGRGYLGGYRGNNASKLGRTLGNTTEGGSDTYSGGSYGGYGGKYTYNNKTYDSNKIYGSIDNPSDPGSGGGGLDSNSAGGCGGGVLTLRAAEIVNNGSILSNGQDKTYGAGSGGSIKIYTGILNGSGMITANGGSSSNYGAGSGGRIALFYEDASGFNLANIKAYGGKYTPGGNSTLNASAGTVYLKQTNQEAQLIINNNTTITTYREIFPVIGPGVITDLSETVLTDATASYMTDSLTGMELIPDIDNKEQTFTIIDNDKNTITIDSSDGNLLTATAEGKTYGGMAVFDGHLKITNSTISTINGETRLGSLSVLEGSRLKPPAVTATSEYYLYLNVPGKIIVDATSYIEAIGLGYLGGIVSGSTYLPGYTLGNTTTGGSTRYSGGSYGGLGGKYLTYDVNNAYGSLYSPRNPGSGGGGTTTNVRGGSGGGVIILEAGEIQLAGIISVNGNINNTAGSGSGGSILLKTTTLTGSGSITANGGSSTGGCGGSGGRIAVYYNDASQFDLTKITAYGGAFSTGTDSSTRNGAAGTVFLKQNSATFGDLIVNNNNLSSRTDSTPLPAVGQGFNSLLESHHMTVSIPTFIPGALVGTKLNPQPAGNTLFTIIDNNGTDIFTDPADGDMTQIGSQNGPYIGEHLLFNLTVKGSAHLFTTDRIQVSGTLIKEPGSTLKAENHQ